jgi:hypothetical protein
MPSSFFSPPINCAAPLGSVRNAMALARVQVRRDREITLARQPAGDVANVLVQPPPFLHYDRRRR